MPKKKKWIPKYPSLQLRALDIYDEHTKNLEQGIDSMKSAEKLAKKYKLTMRSIYRHLEYAKTVQRA